MKHCNGAATIHKTSEMTFVVSCRSSWVGDLPTLYNRKNRGSTPDRGNFFCLQRVQTDSGAHPVSYSVGTGDDFPRGKTFRTWDCSLPYNAEIKNKWRYTTIGATLTVLYAYMKDVMSDLHNRVVPSLTRQ
jgi:hypothetical protein